MKRTAFVAAVLALALVGSASAQIVLRAGDDPFSTPGGGTTTVDLAGYPIKEVFGAPVDGSTVVGLKGESLGPQSVLAGIDTIVRRPADIVVNGSTASGPLRLMALRLRSESPVSIGGVPYTLRVFLSEFRSGIVVGTLTVTFTNGDGGTFSSSFNVRPKLAFTDPSGRSTIIDCGAIACGSGADLALTVSGAPFTRSGGPGGFSPTSKGIRLLPAGVPVDADGNGTADFTTLASTNFFVAVTPVQPFPITSVIKQENGGRHGFFPPIPSATAAVAPFPSTAPTSGN